MAIDSAPEVVGWLNRKPVAATIDWGDDGLTVDHPYVSRAADPVVADCPVMWPWHVVGPDEPDLRGSGSPTLVLEYDLDVYELWPSGPCNGPLGAWMAQHDRPLDVVSARTLGELRALPGALLVLCGGWLPCSISRRLQDWTQTCANRPDLRFRWNPAQRSAVLTTFSRSVRHFQSAGRASRAWAVLQPAPEIRTFEAEPEQGSVARNERRDLRIAHARRWARRMRIDPALAWLTPADVRMLLELDPVEDVFVWASRHHVLMREGPGIEPVFAATTVLSLAES